MAINPTLLMMLMQQAPQLLQVLRAGSVNTNTGFEEIPNSYNFPNIQEALNRGYDAPLLEASIGNYPGYFDRSLGYTLANSDRSLVKAFPSEHVNASIESLQNDASWYKMHPEASPGTPALESAMTFLNNPEQTSLDSLYDSVQNNTPNGIPVTQEDADWNSDSELDRLLADIQNPNEKILRRYRK